MFRQHGTMGTPPLQTLAGTETTVDARLPCRRREGIYVSVWVGVAFESLRGLAMRPMKYIVAAALLGLFGQAALAFEETTIGAGDRQKAPAAPVLDLPNNAPDATKGLSLTPQGLHLGETPGTEVRIPGLGTVGVLPKLDFGLELLYGASEQKGLPQDKTDPDDVQLRGTIKHRF